MVGQRERLQSQGATAEGVACGYVNHDGLVAEADSMTPTVVAAPDDEAHPTVSVAARHPADL